MPIAMSIIVTRHGQTWHHDEPKYLRTHNVSKVADQVVELDYDIHSGQPYQLPQEAVEPKEFILSAITIPNRSNGC